MFDFAWSELALIAVVALVVIGPKDLPRVMRVVGQWVHRARSIAREFQSSLDQMVREAELDEMKRHVDQAVNMDIEREIKQAVDPGGEIQRSLSDPVLANPLLDPAKPAEPSDTPSLPPPTPGPEPEHAAAELQPAQDRNSATNAAEPQPVAPEPEPPRR